MIYDCHLVDPINSTLTFYLNQDISHFEVDRSEIDVKSNSLKSTDNKSTNGKSNEVVPSTPITCWNGVDEEDPDLPSDDVSPSVKQQVFQSTLHSQILWRKGAYKMKLTKALLWLEKEGRM